MSRIFIVKGRNRKDIGQIIFSDGKFKVQISSKKDQEFLEEVFNEFFQKGIKYLGPVVLDKPIKSNNPLFLKAIENFMESQGYSFTEKKD